MGSAWGIGVSIRQAAIVSRAPLPVHLVRDVEPNCRLKTGTAIKSAISLEAK